MTGRLLLTLVAFAACGFAWASPVPIAGGSLAAAIDSTDVYLAQSGRFEALKRKSIEVSRQRFNDSGDDTSAEAALALGRSFRRYNVDSSAYYYDRAMCIAAGLGDEQLRARAMLELAAVNPLRGIVKESVDMFEAVDRRSLSSVEELQFYFDRGFEVYVTIASFYGDDPNGQRYLGHAMEFSDSLVVYLPHGSPHQLYHKGWSALNRADYVTALSELQAALEQSTFATELYPRIAASLADLYQKIDDPDRATYFLALSAMSDIAAGTKETTSLQRLGLELYGRGEIERAHRYLNHALENSIESGSKIRTLNEINILPVVSKAYGDIDASRIKWLYFLITVLSLAMIAFAVMVVVIYRSKTRLAAYRSRLTAANEHKDDYINQILALCSSYIERIEELNRLVVRKIKAGQSVDLLHMVESGEMSKEQNDKFLQSFDKAFLSFYPDFIAEINCMLKDDARFINPAGDTLNPELRIAAMMRLGVDDSARIARLLGLSLNTVYTYRNKLRNRARDRENFEENLRKSVDFSQ